MMEILKLSRRNLVTLLNKLDRAKTGETSKCTLIKTDIFNQSMPSITVTAVEDEEYYQGRDAGSILAVDAPVEDELKVLVREFFTDYLDYTETKGIDEHEVHPIQISCGRVLKAAPLSELLKKMKALSK